MTNFENQADFQQKPEDDAPESPAFMPEILQGRAIAGLVLAAQKAAGVDLPPLVIAGENAARNGVPIVGTAIAGAIAAIAEAGKSTSPLHGVLVDWLPDTTKGIKRK